MEFLKEHAQVYWILAAILILTGAYPIYSLFHVEHSPCRPIINACRDQRIIGENVRDGRELFQKCLLPVFETLRLGNMYFDARTSESCRQMHQRKRAKAAADQEEAADTAPED
jgi:hypothetical protein